MAQRETSRSEVLELVEQLDDAIREQIVDLPLVRELVNDLIVKAEQEAWRLKFVADIANHGTPTRMTLRWAQELARKVTVEPESPPAA